MGDRSCQRRSRCQVSYGGPNCTRWRVAAHRYLYGELAGSLHALIAVTVDQLSDSAIAAVLFAEVDIQRALI